MAARDTLDRIFQELKSKNDSIRLKAAQCLRQTLDAAHRELPPGQFAGYYSDILQRVSVLVVQGSDSTERIGGIHALTALIDFRGDDFSQKTTRFSNNLRIVLRGNDTNAMVYAAQALGKLATPGSSLTAELVDSEVNSALEYLQSEKREQEHRRFASVLVLRELARNSPILFYTYIPQIFDVIWSAIRDTKVFIREAGAEAISACFEIMAARDSLICHQWFNRVYDEVFVGFSMNSVNALHGSLLTIKELLTLGAIFMHGTRYKESCDIVLRYKDHRDSLIHREVINIMPILAGYAPDEFSVHYLHQCMMYLQSLLKRDKDKGISFISIGKIAGAVTSNISPYLDGIISHIRDSLQARVKGKTPVEASIFECLSMLAIAVGHTMTKHIPNLLDPMFMCGLSESLTQALVDIAHYIPALKGVIQDRLLDLLSQVLSGRPYNFPGSLYDSPIPPQIWSRDHKDSQTIERKEQELCLALHTLGGFDFSGHILNEFVRDVTIRYVEADSPEIRKAAALTCCQLYVRDPIIFQTGQHAMQVVGEIIEKLLAVAISDPEPEIRRTVLESLDPRFDRHLGKPENIRILFLVVNDEVFAVREVAMTIIGRVISYNPAYVFPSLRKVLIQLLTEVEYTSSTRNREESVRLIGHLVALSPSLIKSYVNPILEVLLPKARDSNPEVAGTMLSAIGNLVAVAGSSILSYVPQLMECIIEHLQDLSSDSKRIAAVRALDKLATSASYVIQPYIEHRQLITILHNIIKTETASQLRHNVVKLVGVLGALDPEIESKLTSQNHDKDSLFDLESVTDVTLIMNGTTPSSEEYYITVVIHTLMGLLNDSSLAQSHSAIIDAIMNIYATLGVKCVSFLNQVIPGFLLVMQSAAPTRVEGYFNQLSQLVRIVRHHIRPYLPQILDAIREFWYTKPQLQGTILTLIEAISRSLEGDFKVYLANVLPLMLAILDQDGIPRRIPSERVLHALLVFGASAEEYMHLIIPAIVKVFDKPAFPIHIRRQAIEVVGRLSRKVNLSEFASCIIHPLTRVLAGSDLTLRSAALETLCALVYQWGPDFIHFIPMVNKVLQTHKIAHHNYTLLVTKLQKGESLPQDLSPDQRYGDDDDDHFITEPAQKKLPVNQQHLKHSWEASQNYTREDWIEWMRRFSVELLRESPQHALRACTALASVYTPVARALFNSAFVSCWTELYDQYQMELVHSIELALTSSEIPPDILQMLLNLVEFMEHDDKTFPIDVRLLGAYAGRCHAFAKALHYKELEFNAEQNPSSVEALIGINNHLQQYDAAFGILRKAQSYHDVNLKEYWFEKLFRWDEALAAYERKEKEEGSNSEIVMGKMRCLHALGEWDLLSNLAQSKWGQATPGSRRLMAPLAAAAAWGLGKWELMDQYLSVMKATSPDRFFFGAIVSIHRNQFNDAQVNIEKARGLLETELSALLSESYDRAYLQVLRVQMLTELEEIMVYKQEMLKGNDEKLQVMRNTWTARLKGCQKNPEVWQRMMKVRSLVLKPRDNLEIWIKFTNLSRNHQRMRLAEKSLGTLLETNEAIPKYVQDNYAIIEPKVSYAALKFCWAKGERELALETAKKFCGVLAEKIHSDSRELSMITSGSEEQGETRSRDEILKSMREYSALLAKCYVQRGTWQMMLNNEIWSGSHVKEVLASFKEAIRYNEANYKAWHAWALANFDLVTEVTANNLEDRGKISESIVRDHVIPAVSGFFRSISLLSSSALQDTLRLLTLWFSYGVHPEVCSAIMEGIVTVKVDIWLEVIPQLLARINLPERRIRESIHRLLINLGKTHPQALVFPFTVSINSDVGKSKSASILMETMRLHSQKLVEQADWVSRELIRIAVLWHEQWFEALEEASRVYFGNHDVEGMFAILKPLHKMLDKEPETLREISFIQSFGRELKEARDWCKAYEESGDSSDLNQAWDLYHQVFRRLQGQLPMLTALELQYVSPKLNAARNLELAVPGTYACGKTVNRIAYFEPVSSIIISKQRPRKIKIRGSDGENYQYILKGHEDIRQDERVMQLFSLCNTLLHKDIECRKRHLDIQRYAVIPLSTQSGLLGFVPNSDTFHMLIREYRENRKILINIEHRIMLQMAPDYDNLTLLQKVEVFAYALDNTTGQDLYRVLWLKSKSSEAWLVRRTNYTRSLATMSMVGYILGLGDRHPSNLMLNRATGKIIHIDFGDCFEVAMHREKYPERVPFRLTRMLTYAMEVSNIEGSYRITCEHVMRVMRENKGSVMAVLEAFIHDPLLTWRLEGNERETTRSRRWDGKPVTNDNEEEFKRMGFPVTRLLADYQRGTDEKSRRRLVQTREPLVQAERNLENIWAYSKSHHGNTVITGAAGGGSLTSSTCKQRVVDGVKDSVSRKDSAVRDDSCIATSSGMYEQANRQSFDMPIKETEQQDLKLNPNSVNDSDSDNTGDNSVSVDDEDGDEDEDVLHELDNYIGVRTADDHVTTSLPNHTVGRKHGIDVWDNHFTYFAGRQTQRQEEITGMINMSSVEEKSLPCKSTTAATATEDVQKNGYVKNSSISRTSAGNGDGAVNGNAVIATTITSDNIEDDGESVLRQEIGTAAVFTTVADTEGIDVREVQNARALQVLARVREKLTGRDFRGGIWFNEFSGAPGLNGGGGVGVGSCTGEHNGSASGVDGLRKVNVVIGYGGTSLAGKTMGNGLGYAGISSNVFLPAIPVARRDGANGHVGRTEANDPAAPPASTTDEAYSVEAQTDRLICEATNLENLCQHFVGWCAFW